MGIAIPWECQAGAACTALEPHMGQSAAGAVMREGQGQGQSAAGAVLAQDRAVIQLQSPLHPRVCLSTAALLTSVHRWQ